MGTTHCTGTSQRQLRSPAAVRDPESLTALFDSQEVHPFQDDLRPNASTPLGKKPPSCHLHCINLARETNAIVQSTTNSEKNCWWQKITGCMWRIQCAFVKKNLLTCSIKLFIKALREATEWWTKELPSSLFNTFESTDLNLSVTLIKYMRS